MESNQRISLRYRAALLLVLALLALAAPGRSKASCVPQPGAYSGFACQNFSSAFASQEGYARADANVDKYGRDGLAQCQALPQAFYPGYIWRAVHDQTYANGSGAWVSKVACWSSSRRGIDQLETSVTFEVSFVSTWCAGSAYWNGATNTCVSSFDPAKNNTCDATTGCLFRGNPIHMFTGAKIQTETDFSLGRLALTRHFSSAPGLLPVRAIMGDLWRHNFMAEVRFTSVAAGASAIAVRPSGDALNFVRGSDGSWTPDADVVFRLQTSEAGGQVTSWTLTHPDGTREIYDAQGRLISIEYRDGEILAVAQGDLGPTTVSDRAGRSIAFQYAAGMLAGVTLPDAATVLYHYDGSRRLDSVTYAKTGSSNSAKSYVYEQAAFPKFLSGVIDELGDRYATWVYDTGGRAISSAHGPVGSGIERVEIAYVVNGSTVTNALGSSVAHTDYGQFGRLKLASSQNPCASCGGLSSETRTYDTSGFLDIAIDLKGNRTDYDFSSSGQLTQRIDASSDIAGSKRTTQTDWHPTFNLPLERRTYNAASTLVRKEIWTYNSRGQVLTHSVNEF